MWVKQLEELVARLKQENMNNTHAFVKTPENVQLVRFGVTETFCLQLLYFCISDVQHSVMRILKLYLKCYPYNLGRVVGPTGWG